MNCSASWTPRYCSVLNLTQETLAVLSMNNKPHWPNEHFIMRCVLKSLLLHSITLWIENSGRKLLNRMCVIGMGWSGIENSRSLVENCLIQSVGKTETRLQETLRPGHVLFHSVEFRTLHLAIFLRRDLIWVCSGIHQPQGFFEILNYSLQASSVVLSNSQSIYFYGSMR